MTFTKEQMARLKELEGNLKRAYKYDYICAMTESKSLLAKEIYEEATGMEVEYNPSCGGCVLNLFRKLGKLYFEQLEAQEKKKRTPKKK